MFHIIDIALFSMFAAICFLMTTVGAVSLIKYIKRRNNSFNRHLRSIVKIIEKYEGDTDKYTGILNVFCDKQGFDEWRVGLFTPEDEVTTRPYLTFYKNDKEVMCIEISEKIIRIGGKAHALDM